MTAGLVIVTIGALGASQSDSLLALGLWFFVGGVGAGSTNSASGRVVVGWFPAHRRGTAMGIRQTGLPLGVGLAALLVPNIVKAHGLSTTLLAITAITAAATLLCAVLIVRPAAADPQRGRRPRAPRQPVHPRLSAVAHPPRLGPARRPAVHGVDLHAGVAHRRQGLVDVRRQRPGRLDAAARCGRPDRRRLVVRPGRQSPRAHAHRRDRGRRDDAVARACSPARPSLSR